MRPLAVPYHLDEHLPGLDFPLDGAEAVRAHLGGGGPWERMAVLYDRLADVVAGAVSRRELPVVASGDCTTALGTMAGLQRAGVTAGVVWLDAHGDLHTPDTTSSGYLGGMPLRLLAGGCPELISDRLGLRPVPEEQIVLAGARDLDPPEARYLSGARIGVCDVGGLAAAELPGGPLYVHLDADVIDPAEIPGLRFPAAGGPGRGTVASALSALAGTGRAAALGIACTWRPGHDAAASFRHVLPAAMLA